MGSGPMIARKIRPPKTLPGWAIGLDYSYLSTDILDEPERVKLPARMSDHLFAAMARIAFLCHLQSPPAVWPSRDALIASHWTMTDGSEARLPAGSARQVDGLIKSGWLEVRSDGSIVAQEWIRWQRAALAAQLWTIRHEATS
ncbi:MAG TPA: hypothetical protein VIK06_06580 [Candidatus Limnocylindrales bacterium]